MKKSHLFSFIITIGLLFSGCAGTEKQLTSVKSVHNDTSIKAVNAFTIQLGNNRPDAAWYRMSEEYKISINESQFVENWKNATEAFGELKECKEAVLLFDGTYQVITVPIIFSKGKIFATFTIFAESLNPLDIKYSNTVPEYKEILSSLNESELSFWKKEADELSGKYDLYPALTEPALKDLCKDYFKIGCGITGASPMNAATKSPEFMAVATKHFSSWSATNLMKPSYLLQQKASMENSAKGDENPVLDFSAADMILRQAKESGIEVRGHTLVWHTQIPEWFFLEGYKSGAPVVDKETMKFRMESYIRQYITYCQENYPGVVYCWDVVNEAVDPKGDKSVSWSCRQVNDNYDNMWYKALGTDYVELAFEYARKYAAPDVKLFYNDYGTCDRTKRQLIHNLLCMLKEKNLVDGIGMQGYWDLKNPDLQTIKDTIDLYASTGLEIQFTEWSISSPDESEENMTLQAERYAQTFRLLQKMDTQGGGTANITCVSFFGVMNHYMFIKDDKTNCRPFNENLEPNKMFYAIKDTFDMFY